MSDPRDFSVYHLLFKIVCSFVDHPDKVVIRAVSTKSGATFTISVHTEDVGKVIGRQGRTAKSMRTIVSELGTKRGRSCAVVVDENPVDSQSSVRNAGDATPRAE
jgi:uncharacterized protein